MCDFDFGFEMLVSSFSLVHFLVILTLFRHAGSGETLFGEGETGLL